MYNGYQDDIDDLFETNKFGYKYVRLDKKPADRLVQAYVEKYNINTDCHHSCLTCQITHIDKYKYDLEMANAKSIKETGKPLEKWFPVKCNYIPKGIRGDIKSQIKEIAHNLNADEGRARKILLSSIDPSAWTELMFGFDDKTQENTDMSEQWYLRWYQKHILRCSANRMVLRIGRRGGKSSSIAWKLIYLIFNYKVFAGYNSTGEKQYQGPEIVIITPFTSQVKNIFGDIERFLKLNKDLAEMTNSRGGKLYSQTPPLKMEFKNGGSITGYVSGANAKDDETGGGIIRGENAHIIYLDEMDMIPDSILNKVIQPLLLTRPNVLMFASSTPIGKKGMFFKWSLEASYFKEVYAPSTVLPFWDSVEKEILEESTLDAFKAEYMADFIEQQAGVFKHRYIQEARADYLYTETEDTEFWIKTFGEDFHKFRICMGIDWNKNAGTEFCVTAFSPRTGRFFVLETINIPPSEFSSEAYKEEVKRLNFKWRPNYIYADEGYGHTMIEDLQVEAISLSSKTNRSPYEQTIVELQEKLKSLNFSSNIELLNPATGTYFKKYAKNFLVENAVKLMERTRIKFSESDKILVKQLGNYIVKKQHDSGKLIYDQNNEGIGDHRLDAYILSLGGLALEESVFSTNYGPPPDTYYVSKKDDTENFESSMQEALGILKVLKKQKSGVQLDVLAIRRGNGTVEQERHIYNQQKWEEGQDRPHSTGRADITSSKPVKGYFSEKGLATHSETRKGEEIDANYMFSKPIKMDKKKRGIIRTNIPSRRS